MRFGVALLALLAIAACDVALAQGRRGGGPPEARAFDEATISQVGAETAGAFIPGQANFGAMQARGFFATGLIPVYPERVSCPTLNSAFAATTRGDGSQRARQFFLGYHGGIDIPVAEGTPVLAVADGKVVHKSPGEAIGGIGIVLQHAPADTGLSVWVYSEYKHLMRLPEIEVGMRVRMGETIALSGRTGTQGGHYGPGGHPHLHLSAWHAQTEEHDARRIVLPKDGHWLDPLALFRGPPVDSTSLAALPGDQKRVPIPYLAADGQAQPAGTKFVWPLGCAAKN